MSALALPLVLLMPVMFLTALSDLRALRIPNALVLAALAVFILTSPFLPFSEVLLRLLAGGVCFGILFALYCFRILGGGDVKMLSALCLFVPSPLWSVAPYVFSAAMLLGVAITVAMQRGQNQQEPGSWVSMRHSGKFPMGISIAMTAVGLLVLSLSEL